MPKRALITSSASSLSRLVVTTLKYSHSSTGSCFTAATSSASTKNITSWIHRLRRTCVLEQHVLCTHKSNRDATARVRCCATSTSASTFSSRYFLPSVVHPYFSHRPLSGLQGRQVATFSFFQAVAHVNILPQPFLRAICEPYSVVVKSLSAYLHHISGGHCNNLAFLSKQSVCVVMLGHFTLFTKINCPTPLTKPENTAAPRELPREVSHEQSRDFRGPFLHIARSVPAYAKKKKSIVTGSISIWAGVTKRCYTWRRGHWQA